MLTRIPLATAPMHVSDPAPLSEQLKLDNTDWPNRYAKVELISTGAIIPMAGAFLSTLLPPPIGPAVEQLPLEYTCRNFHALEKPSLNIGIWTLRFGLGDTLVTDTFRSTISVKV